MGHHCCSKQKVKRGLWSPEEDEKLVQYITAHGHGCWSAVPKQAGLQRCGKSCRLRWINYLRPDLKRGTFTEQEERIIIDVHRILGNRWAQIAKHLPGRTDNEVKNFWNSCIKKKLIAQGLDPKTHNLLPSSRAAGGSGSNLPQISAAPFTIISSSAKHSNGAAKAGKSSASRPVVTLPSSSAGLRHRNIDAAQEITLQRQEPEGLLMSFRSQEQPPISPADYCGGNGVISSPLLHAQLVSSAFSPLGFMDEAAMLWSPAADQTTPTCAPNHASAQQMINGGHDLGHTTVPDFGVGEQPGQQKNISAFDPSYGTASFDLDLIDMAPLIPGDAFCGASSMEQFRWDC